MGRGVYGSYYKEHMDKIKGEGKNSVGNVEAKELISMTHGHELWGGGMWEGGGWAGWSGVGGEMGQL